MELEMYINGKFIDSIPITASQLARIHELQHRLEKKHCNELEYTDDQPQFYINGVPSSMNEEFPRKKFLKN